VIKTKNAFSEINFSYNSEVYEYEDLYLFTFGPVITLCCFIDDLDLDTA